MITVPSFLLKRLYVKGSLKNDGDGFQLQLKNSLGSGYAQELLPVTVDGQEMPKEKSFFVLNSEEIPFSQVSPEAPFTLAMNRVSTLMVKGVTLSPGVHRISLGFVVKGIGRMSFEVTDTAADQG